MIENENFENIFTKQALNVYFEQKIFIRRVQKTETHA